MAYQWYANGVAVSGATNQSYTLKADDAGKVIAVKAVFTDNAGYDESVTSATSMPVELWRLWSSKPYPALVSEEDAYMPAVAPLDITLKRVLVDTAIDDKDAYMPAVKPLDITLKSSLEDKVVTIDSDAYQPSVKPLDITLKSLLMSKNIDDKDAYTPSVKPLDITLKRVLVTQNVDDKDAYMPSVKPLDITLKTGV